MLRRSGVRLCLIGVGSVSTLGYALNFDLAPFVDRIGLGARAGDPLGAYPVLYLTLFALYAVAVAAVLRKGHGSSHLGLILGFAVLFRVALLFAPLILSSDLYRYVWDGRVQAAGTNPYRFPPAAPELAALRDGEIFPRLNRPEAPTIYPPGAQVFFATVALAFPDSVLAMKGIMLLFDLGTLLLILRLLRRTGMDPDRVLLYAWSPLVLFELAGSGHLEAVMLPFVLLAVLATMGRRPGLAGAALGTATLIKFYPAALFPALYRRGDRVFPFVFATMILAGYLLYLPGAGGQVLGFLPAYFGPWEDFNIGLRDVLAAVLATVMPSARLAAMLLVTALLGAVALTLGRQGMDGDVPWRAFLMVSAYFILLPTSFHPWYLTWILPFLCLYPVWGWLYLSGAIALSYFKYLQEPAVLPLAIRLLEFVPLYLLLGLEALRQRISATRAARVIAPIAEESR